MDPQICYREQRMALPEYCHNLCSLLILFPDYRDWHMRFPKFNYIHLASLPRIMSKMKWFVHRCFLIINDFNSKIWVNFVRQNFLCIFRRNKSFDVKHSATKMPKNKKQRILPYKTRAIKILWLIRRAESVENRFHVSFQFVCTLLWSQSTPMLKTLCNVYIRLQKISFTLTQAHIPNAPRLFHAWHLLHRSHSLSHINLEIVVCSWT